MKKLLFLCLFLVVSFSFYLFRACPEVSSAVLRGYQLAFVIPGIFPSEAILRNFILEIPKRRIYPRPLPVSLHRCLSRTGEASLGNLSSPR